VFVLAAVPVVDGGELDGQRLAVVLGPQDDPVAAAGPDLDRPVPGLAPPAGDRPFRELPHFSGGS
jgi:hypothetical protein